MPNPRIVWVHEQLIDDEWLPQVSFCGPKGRKYVNGLHRESSPEARKVRRVVAYVPRRAGRAGR